MSRCSEAPPRTGEPRPGGWLAVPVLGLLLAGAGAVPAADEARLREAARLRGAALAEMEDGNFGRAEPLLVELAGLLPDNVLPPINLAICYLRLNRLEEALEQVGRARQLDPDNPQMLFTLARILEQDPAAGAAWKEIVDHFARAHRFDPRPHYLRGQAHERAGEPAAAVEALRRALELAPDNLVVMADLLAAAAAAGDRDATEEALDAIEDRLNGFEGSLAGYAERLRDRLDAGDAGGLRPPALVARNLLRPTELFQLGLVPLTGGRGDGGDLFPQQDFDPPLPKSIQGGQDIELVFTDATETAGPGALAPGVALVADPSAASDALLAVGSGGVAALRLEDGRFRSAPIGGGAVASKAPAGAVAAVAYDIDQDEISDLVTAAAGDLRFHPGLAGGGFGTTETLSTGALGDRPGAIYPLDVDHDGDLDLFVARRAAPDLYLQNSGDGSWPERAAELGIDGGEGGTTGVASADFDDDGDLDLLTVRPGGPPRLYLNRRTGAFEEASSAWGLSAASTGFGSVRVADFDNDGRFDLLLWGERGGALYLNRGSRFEPAPLPGPLAVPWSAAAVADLDNDADQDVAAVAGGRLLLVRNRRDGFAVEQSAVDGAGVVDLLPGDFDDDGDLDLVARTATGARFWRNDGGNRNQWVRLRLKGKNDNNAKNNTQALFTRIEARIGDHLQVVLGNGRLNHLGLGARRQIDVIRVVWTNGLAQTWQAVGANRTLVEEQVLKGSCPFLYAFNGERFEFVTDLMWKSPLGMLLADGSPAPHQSARDFVLVPGEALAAAGGELWLQITEELWETAYVDRVRLLAVDHPAEVRPVVDERFLPPPYATQPPLHWIGRALEPVAAVDERGRDVLERVRLRDGRHVDDLPLDRYQGLTRGHHLELAFTGVPAGERLRLLLWGWIFPTDTSINFALAQDSGRAPVPPALEVLGEDGAWRRVEPFIGFPNGKRKAMVVELTGRVPAGDLRLRLPTSMQIYWDAAALAVGEPAAAPAITALEPAAAELHYRGYSALYRETPTGPHLFDYRRVAIGPRFRDLGGAYTRFGPVTELLERADDRYVVMNAGDEMTVRFDASELPPLAPGWRRDYVLYTDGWVKDGDIHTAFSQTVEPLPYHGMRAYPDAPEHRYPDSPDHRQYLETYQTRQVDDRPFATLLRP